MQTSGAMRMQTSAATHMQTSGAMQIQTSGAMHMQTSAATHIQTSVTQSGTWESSSMQQSVSGMAVKEVSKLQSGRLIFMDEP